MTLTGKSAVVTGASSGIGEATARLLAKRVQRRPRHPPRGPAKEPRCGSRRRDARRPTDPAACEALISRAVESFGTLEILVANAGLGPYGSIPGGEPDDWRQMFEINVLGVLYTTRAAVRHMLGLGSGDVVLVSSLAGRRVPGAEVSTLRPSGFTCQHGALQTPFSTLSAFPPTASPTLTKRNSSGTRYSHRISVTVSTTLLKADG